LQATQDKWGDWGRWGSKEIGGGNAEGGKKVMWSCGRREKDEKHRQGGRLGEVEMG